MIYRDESGHNFTRTKYLDKMPDTKDDSKSGLIEPPKLTNSNDDSKVSSVLKPFSTHRISSSLLAQWPTELGFDLVNRIQDGCSDLVGTFGYKMVIDELSYKNKSISYLPDFT